MPKFRNKTGVAVEAIRTEMRPLDDKGVIEVPGKLVTSRPKPKDGEPEPEPIPDDAYLVEHEGEERAWPHANWELVEDKPSGKSDKADKES